MPRTAKRPRRARRCHGCALVPGHVFGEVIKRSTDHAERSRAMSTLNLSSQLQGFRMGVSALPSGMATRSPGSAYRLVYDGSAKTRLPGGMVRREGQGPARIPSVDEAFDGAGATYDFFQQIFRRESLDGKGLVLAATANYGRNYSNALWNGSQMIYGEGDGKLFGRFTRCLDIIAHELTHGFTQYCSNLEYEGEPGALNESLSDVFGSMVKQWTLGHRAETADWLIGQGLFGPGVDPRTSRALRSMAEPGTAYDDRLLGKDLQVGHYSQLRTSEDDNGGVHTNSGIPNKAFQRACMALGGPAWAGVGRVWYEVAAKKLWADANFQDMADLTWHTAGELFGDGKDVQKAVADGWNRVGIVPRP